MSINVRAKGQRAERQIVQLLQPIVDTVYAEFGIPKEKIPSIERNQNQSWKGGYDLIGLDWLAPEIKHQENLQVNAWWEQCKKQAKENQEPTLFYKQNNVKWRVRMFGALPCGDLKITCPVEVSMESYLVYFEHRLRGILKNAC